MRPWIGLANGRQEHRLVEVFNVDGRLDADWPPLIACVARVSRLTYEKDIQSGLWPTREEVGYYPCQIRLDAKPRLAPFAPTGASRPAIITSATSPWANTPAAF